MIGIKGIAKKPIIDATASSEDVISGKVFYNNHGKQEGAISKDLCYKEITIYIPKNKYSSYTEVEACDLDSDVGSSDNVYLPNGINIVRNCRLQSNNRGYSYQKILDHSVDLNIDLSNVAYFVLNGVKYAFASKMTENSYYGHSFLEKTRYYCFNYLLLYMDQGILKSVSAATEYDEYGNLEQDITLSIIYHN